MKAKSSLEQRVALTQEVQLVCACCNQAYHLKRFRDDVLFGAEKYAVCPLCNYVVPTSVFHDETYRSCCRRVYAKQQKESAHTTERSEEASPKSYLRVLLDKISEERAGRKSNGLRFKVAEKGGVSVYGLARFPLTLYYEQWLRLLDRETDIREFLESNKSRLKLKDN